MSPLNKAPTEYVSSLSILKAKSHLVFSVNNFHFIKDPGNSLNIPQILRDKPTVLEDKAMG